MELAVCRFRPPPTGRLVIWELTNHCNLTCLHCCTNSSPHVSRSEDASCDDICRALSYVGKANIKEIYFTGGEPFVRKDFVEILKAACKTPATIYVATNGTLLRREHVLSMQDIGIKTITISLDGHTEALHNAIRQHPSAFSKAIQGIEMCVDAKLPLRISHMLTPDNLHYIEEMCHFIASLGVKSLALNSIIGAGRAGEHNEIIISQSLQYAIATIGRMQEFYKNKISIDHSLSKEGSAAPVGCPAGDRVLHISGNGDVSICSWLYKIDKSQYAIGNLKTTALDEILRDPRSCLRGVNGIETSCPIPELLKVSTENRRKQFVVI